MLPELVPLIHSLGLLIRNPSLIPYGFRHPKVRRIREEYRRRLWQAYDGSPVYTDLGINLFLNPFDTVVSFHIFHEHVWEPATTALVCKEIREGMVVLDAGANLGYYTVLASKLVKEGGVVLAFEPAPENYQLMLRNVKLNSCENVRSFSLAVSDHSGFDDLFLADSNMGMHSLRKFVSQHTASVRVKKSTIDELLEGNPRKPDFAKIDVEGHELYCLLGMERTIRASQDLRILLEFSPSQLGHHDSGAKELLDFLESMGYAAFEIGNDGELQLKEKKDLLTKYTIENKRETNLYFERR